MIFVDVGAAVALDDSPERALQQVQQVVVGPEAHQHHHRNSTTWTHRINEFVKSPFPHKPNRDLNQLSLMLRHL